MNDAISRLGVSAWLANMGRTKLAEYILDEDRFPSVNKWIPVNEFPKTGGYHLVTTDKGYVDIAWFDLATYTCNCGWREVKDRPIAWMPLPRPYEVGGTE